MAIRKDKKFQNQVSLNEPIGFDSDGNEVSLMDVLQSDNEDICEKIDKENLVSALYRKIKTTLAEREQQILCLRYGLFGLKALPQREVADILGISRSYVSRIETKAIDKLCE